MKKLLLAIPICAVVGIGILVYQIVQKTQKNVEIEMLRSTLPDFDFQDLNGNSFKTENLNPDKNIVIIGFTPDCDFCQYEAKSISENISAFTDSNIIMVSNAKKETIEEFGKEYELLEHHNLSIVLDIKNKYSSYFKTESIPSIFIYGKNHELIKHFSGKTPIESLIKYASISE